MSSIRSHRHFRNLLSLGLPSTDFVIAGSAALFARGLIRGLGDLDIVAQGAAWHAVRSLGLPCKTGTLGVHVIELFGGTLQIFDGWFPLIWSTQELISRAEIIDGLPFVPIDVVHHTMRMLARPKDLSHLEMLRGL